MGPTEKSFSQVKAILGKLDRSIDEVRARRTTGDHKAFPVPAAAPAPLIVPATRVPEQPANRQNSPYGRATPLPFGG
ncbi:MAG: hypothetical protein JNM86_15315 [Phycisphaerae bacterium]|nr:hypothetical protein [Phycisphaerae bacterium]MBN8596160.1 hypothetical protein [Planctomycetota bacterium]